jgi:hypothetical protein
MTEFFDFIKSISDDLIYIKSYLKDLKNQPVEKFSDRWIDGQEVMMMLHVSKRTLQTLRDSNVLPFSRINGKFFYKVSDIELLLESNYSNLKSAKHAK